MIIETNSCIGCGKCTEICPVHNLVVNDKKAETILEECTLCGHCIGVCPKNVISISGYDKEQIRKIKDIQLNPNDILDHISFHRTLRKFKQHTIPTDVMEQVLEAGRLTHTGKKYAGCFFCSIR